MRLLLAAALLALSPARGPAAAPGPCADVAILLEDDPAAAAAFLRDDALQASCRAGDPELFQKVFARAAELKDLADLLNGAPEAWSIRAGLEGRARCSFCRKPRELLDWAKAHFPNASRESQAALRQALWEWDTLKTDRRNYLAANGLSEEGWSELDLVQRRQKLQDWADAAYAELMKASPASAKELGAFERLFVSARDMLDNDRLARLSERVAAAEAAVNGLSKARKALGPDADPKLKELLAQAEAAPDLETRVALLSRLMDGLGIEHTALRTTAPAQAGQVFDDAKRAALSGLLASGLMAELEGTWAGAELKAFYAGRALDLKVIASPDRPAGDAFYSEGVIKVNERFIQEYVKGKGRSIDDLRSDKNLLRTLILELSPIFVHEATHQRQEAWAAENGLPFVRSQSLELEAMQTEALFILEKSKRDPSFHDLLQEDAPFFAFAHEAVKQAERLRTGGPAYFRAAVGAQYAQALLSLEGKAWSKIAWDRAAAADMKAELERRRALPPAQAAELAGGPPFPDWIDDEAEWKAALLSVGTKFLEETLKAHLDDADAWPKVYAAYRDRLDAANKTVEERLALLLAGGAPAKLKKEVPSPATAPG